MAQLFESDGGLTFDEIEAEFALLQVSFDEEQSLPGDPRNFAADLSDVYGIDLREARAAPPNKLGRVSLGVSIDLTTYVG